MIITSAVATLLLGGLLVLGIVIITIVAIIIHRSSVKKDTIEQVISKSRISEGLSIGKYNALWAECVTEVGLTKGLSGWHNMLILGNDRGNRRTVIADVVDQMNILFPSTKHAAVFIDIGDLIEEVSINQRVSLKALYRLIVLSPSDWLDKEFRLLNIKSRKLQRKRSELEERLGVWESEMNALAVRNLFYEWMDIAGIDKLSLFLENFFILSADLAPPLLQTMADTFPRGERVFFKLGGATDNLRLSKMTHRGRVGPQLGHDILVELDLDQILKSEDKMPSKYDPRQVFLSRCLERISPEFTRSVGPQIDFDWGGLFEPAEGWIDLFQASDFEVEVVGQALENLTLDIVRSPGRKINKRMIKQAVNRALAERDYLRRTER